ncbi:hypothetical protein N0V90_006677 [Kalmusia sp. IMI 367209]|nr:hypothetical protein N0V90_006677 [Kalmusia sp. IMI 367209]
MSASPPDGHSGAAQKRKNDEGAPQPRAKRNRYISIAWQTPCQRCGNLSLECLYAPNCCNNFKESEEFKQMSGQIALLQEQVDQLFANLSALKSQVDTQSVGSIGTPFNPPDFPRSMSIGQLSVMPPSPARQRSRSIAKRPQFHGPASNAFNLGVAKTSLKTMGITGSGDGEDEGIITMDATPIGSPPPPIAMLPKAMLHADKDPIWSISKQEALSLIHFWQEENGSMYPFLDIGQVTLYAEMLFNFVEAAVRQGLMQGALPGADAIEDEKTSILKLMLAIALVLRGNGKDPLGDKFFNNVQKVVERTMLEPVDVKSINLLIMTDDSTPYLNAMISYSVIGSKVWRSIGNADSPQNTINSEDISFLDFQVLNWHRSIPESLRFVHPDSGRQVDPNLPRAVLRLQVALYLRANQMRILIYRPVLHTATSIAENMDFAKIVVKVSKDTIRTLTYINQTSDIYKAQQIMFNYFLISALAVLFLAVAHAPADFSSQCRDEFYQALDLVRCLSSDSYVSKRLWKTIKMLKEVGPRLGLNVRNEATDAHSSAAVAMAGLAGHQVDEMAIFSNGQNGSIDTPHGMASDLTNLFEAAGNYPMMQNGFGMSSAEITNGEFASAFGQENDELARIMRDLF